MDSSNKFKLEIAVDQYLQYLKVKGNYTDADISELKDHLLDNAEDLMHSGLDEEEAFMIAKKRLGKEEQLSAEFNKVNKGISTQLRSFLLGISFFIVAASLYKIEQHYFYYSIMSGTLKARPAIWINSLFQISIASLIIIYAGRIESIVSYFDRKLKEQPVLVSLIIFMLVCAGMFFTLDNQAVSIFRDPPLIDKENYYTYFGERKWSVILPFIIPVSFLITLFISFYKSSSTKSFSIKELLTGENLLFFYVYGVCFKILASMTFMIGNGLLIYKQLYFGVVYALGVFTVVYFSNKHTLKKMFWFFLIAGFQVESFIALVGKPHPENAMAVFTAMFLAALAGVFFGKLLKPKNVSVDN